MERFLFPSDLQSVPIGRLSGGERRRLYLLSILMEAPNVLLLDEPTNDLDVMTLSILEDYLQGFPGPILIVSHDRFLLDKLAEQVFEVRDGEVLRYSGNWSDWKAKRKEEEAPAKAEKPKAAAGAAPGAETEILFQGAAGVRDHRRGSGRVGAADPRSARKPRGPAAAIM